MSQTARNRLGVLSLIALAAALSLVGLAICIAFATPWSSGWDDLGAFIAILAAVLAAIVLAIAGSVLGLFGLRKRPRRAALIGVYGNIGLIVVVLALSAIQAAYSRRVQEEEARAARARWTPQDHFREAVFSGTLDPHERAEQARAWLGRGADVNHRDEAGRTYVMLAIHHRGVDELRLLLDLEADVLPATPGGWTALHMAAQSSNLEAARLLLAAGADPDARTDTAETPLDLARKREPQSAEVIELLESHAAPPGRP